MKDEQREFSTSPLPSTTTTDEINKNPRLNRYAVSQEKRLKLF